MGPSINHARQLVEMAAAAAYHGEAYLRSSHGTSRQGLRTYWLASRKRLEAWQTRLRQLEQQALPSRQAAGRVARPLPSAVRAAPSDSWKRLAALAEEILASEPLSRIWGAMGCEMARRDARTEAEPFVRSVFQSHLDARQRLLRLSFENLPLSADQLTTLDRLRRQCERWTDVLLGYLGCGHQAAEFAFDAERAFDFAISLRNQSPERREIAQSLLLASLRSTFQADFSDGCPHPRLNGLIVQAVLSCFAADILHATGPFQGLWELRLAQVTEDTSAMVALLAAEHEGAPTLTANAPASASRQ